MPQRMKRAVFKGTGAKSGILSVLIKVTKI
jgi:hypothetical protein